MPRTRKLIRPDSRELAIRQEIGAIKAELMISQGELAKRAGIAPSTLSMRLQEGGLADMKLGEYWSLQDVLKAHRTFGI